MQSGVLGELGKGTVLESVNRFRVLQIKRNFYQYYLQQIKYTENDTIDALHGGEEGVLMCPDA
jgi:hypothetical protein